LNQKKAKLLRREAKQLAGMLSGKMGSEVVDKAYQATTIMKHGQVKHTFQLAPHTTRSINQKLKDIVKAR
jgi:hypothetical protein